MSLCLNVKYTELVLLRFTWSWAIGVPELNKCSDLGI